MMKISVAVLVVAFIALPLAADNPQALTATLDDTHVTVSLSSGSQIVLLGVTLQVERNMLTRRQFSELLTDDDGDGMVDSNFASAPSTLGAADVIIALDPVKLQVRTLAIGN